jgi:hypothetical protein
MPPSRKGINAARLKTIYRRQANPLWDATYCPSILATPQEAPSISRAFILTPAKLHGREVHLLSTAERNAALLGLYHPSVVGLQEQRMLSPEPAPHPLWTFEGIDRTGLPHLRGVIEVAERLGFLDILPRIQVDHPENPGQKITVVFPWIGDLLWAIRSDEGGVFCVNWSIKDKRGDFGRPAPRRDGRPRTPGVNESVLARHLIEKTLYEDVSIRTIPVAGKDIDEELSDNLRQLFLHHRRELGLSREQQEEILHRFRIAMEEDITPGEVITSFVERGRFSVDQCRSLLYQAIWNRQILVDLFSPILINRPLRHQVRDPIGVYADWFREVP